MPAAKRCRHGAQRRIARGLGAACQVLRSHARRLRGRPDCCVTSAWTCMAAVPCANVPCRLQGSSWHLISRFAVRSVRIVRSRLQQHQIVAVDHLVAAAPAEDRLDLVGTMAGDAARLGTGICAKARAPAPRRPVPARPPGSPRSKLPPTARTPAGSSERPAASARAAPASTDERAERRQRARDPAFARGAAFRRGQEPGAARAFVAARAAAGRRGRARSPSRSRPASRSARPRAWCASRPRSSRAAVPHPSPRSPA